MPEDDPYRHPDMGETIREYVLDRIEELLKEARDRHEWYAADKLVDLRYFVKEV